MPDPSSVEIDPSIEPGRIAAGVIIHGGCRIRGEKTSIGPGSVIGAETPATVENCRLGENVSLKGGFFSGSVFLNGSGMGSGAHVRPGTLLEEMATGAHSVGLKQTILLPHVTVGSLVNFCDCLMGGGTGGDNHSEVGSSYVHFNFTPHGDKATPSLIGDVPRGVMLDQPPIFLGGQGGLVGPARIAYGCVIPAGVIHRGDALEEGQLLFPRTPAATGPRPYSRGEYRNFSAILKNNLEYIGNIRALEGWYRHVRCGTMDSDEYIRACHEGALEVIGSVLDERIRRLDDLASRLGLSIELLEKRKTDLRLSYEIVMQRKFMLMWPDIRRSLRRGPGDECGAVARDGFLSEWENKKNGLSHTLAVDELGTETRRMGTAWLGSIVDSVRDLINPVIDRGKI